MASPQETPPPEPETVVRYKVLALTFLMAFMMYMERGAIGAATPSIMREFKVNKITMGWSISAFNFSYALFQIPGGWLADLLGARLVLAGAMVWWALFTASTALATGPGTLAAVRFLFGMGEAAAFPSGSRALVTWLTLRRRAFGQGFQHAGSRFGAAIAPLIVSYLIVVSSWRTCFVLLGMAGGVWAIVWYAYYRNSPMEHRGTNEAERRMLAESAALKKADRGKVPWRRILTSVDVWVLSTTYFCYGWVLWLYLAWFPTYLREARHFSALGAGLASVPLFGATVSNVLGGMFSDSLVAKFRNVRKGRLVVSVAGFLIGGLALLPGVFLSDATASLICLTVALAGLELTVPVSWAMSIDLGGEFSGSVSSVMNTWGNVGGALSAALVGYMATSFGWTSPFVLASIICLLSAVLVMRIDPRPIAPRLK
jgi:MFS family permease